MTKKGRALKKKPHTEKVKGCGLKYPFLCFAEESNKCSLAHGKIIKCRSIAGRNWTVSLLTRKFAFFQSSPKNKQNKKKNLFGLRHWMEMEGRGWVVDGYSLLNTWLQFPLFTVALPCMRPKHSNYQIWCSLEGQCAVLATFNHTLHTMPTFSSSTEGSALVRNKQCITREEKKGQVHSPDWLNLQTWGL